MKLYHVTNPENVDSILKNGLLRCHGDHKSSFICLSEDPDSWIHEGLVLLEVDVDGLKCRMTTWKYDQEYPIDEVCVWGDILPERIKAVNLENKNDKTGSEQADS
jgi:RNA:NAD 2'-phosphotransferase (TPT1/KptA family)